MLQVGNGSFALGLDVTGLQTFMLHGSFGHATLSDWCWHQAANPEGYRPEDTWIEVASGGGRTVPYAANSVWLHRGDEVDPEAMSRTFDLIWTESQEGCWLFWGCDSPMMAMTAARLGKTEEALDILLSEHPNNAVLASGFNPAGSMPYLPATGGLLWATALMAASGEGGPDKPAPGFPDDGSWVVTSL